MKKLLYLFIATALFISCSGDESTPLTQTLTEDDLIGKWDVTAMTSDLDATTTVQGTTVNYTIESYGKDFNIAYDFTSNPNNVSAVGSFTAVVKTTVLGQSQTQEVPASSVEGFDQGTWSLNNNQITITSNGASEVATIESFNNGVMVLKTIVDQSVDVSGSTVNAKGDVVLTLEKQ